MTNLKEQHILRQLHTELHVIMKRFAASIPEEGPVCNILMQFLSLTRSVDQRIKELELKQKNLSFDFTEEHEKKVG